MTDITFAASKQDPCPGSWSTRTNEQQAAAEACADHCLADWALWAAVCAFMSRGGLDVRSYTSQDVHAMWVNVEVDALVKYTKGLQFPSLQAIRWNDRRIDLKGPAQVEGGDDVAPLPMHGRIDALPHPIRADEAQVVPRGDRRLRPYADA